MVCPFGHEGSKSPRLEAGGLGAPGRSERGAKATAILLSITRTIRPQELPLLETFNDLLMASWANEPFDDILDKASADSS